nr:MAG TPA: hypothetical protein [Inoviridae sp.]
MTCPRRTRTIQPSPVVESAASVLQLGEKRRYPRRTVTPATRYLALGGSAPQDHGLLRYSSS